MPHIIDLGDLDLCGVRVRLDEEDGELLLVVGDDDARVTFTAGANGSREQALLGAERLESAARELAQALRAVVTQG